MKYLLTYLCTTIILISAEAQTSSPGKDMQTMENNMKSWAQKNGYRLLIKFAEHNDGSFYAEPNQDYAVFYLYQFNADKAPAFKAYLMTPSDSLRQKYTAHPTEVASSGTSGGQVLQFSTNKKMLEGKTKLPVKLEAKPKARMYVYHKTRKAS
jgi:hypothetical protein